MRSAGQSGKRSRLLSCWYSWSGEGGGGVNIDGEMGPSAISHCVCSSQNHGAAHIFHPHHHHHPLSAPGNHTHITTHTNTITQTHAHAQSSKSHRVFSHSRALRLRHQQQHRVYKAMKAAALWVRYCLHPAASTTHNDCEGTFTRLQPDIKWKSFQLDASLLSHTHTLLRTGSLKNVCTLKAHMWSASWLMFQLPTVLS